MGYISCESLSIITKTANSHLSEMAYQPALPPIASHHLPHDPPKNHEDCLAFRMLSSKLIGWDQLSAHRTEEESMFQHYYAESIIGPEMLWAVYPRDFFYWIPASGSGKETTDFPSEFDKPQRNASLDNLTENSQLKVLCSYYCVEDSGRNPSEIRESYLSTSQPMEFSTLLLPPLQKTSIEGHNFHNQFEAGPYSIDDLSSAPLSLPRFSLKRLQMAEPSLDSVKNIKKQKIAFT